MHILVLNPGSSSLKRGLFRFPEGIELPEDTLVNVDAVGVRVVHGGSRFVKPVRVDDAVVAAIRELCDLAPLHNPVSLAAIEATRKERPGVPIVAAFDTAFHQTLPPLAWHYAVPPDLGVRRYGFHGISYSYVSSRVDARRHVICHLGSGASVCALLDGRSVDTSMGLTPLEGLVMGTRAGDLDPGVVLHLLRQGHSAEELDDLLNHRSGLLGLSGRSADVRELEQAAREGDPRAELALDLFAYRVAKYVGAYTVVLGGLDALTFTAGIGEHSPSMRTRICHRLGFLGVTLDEEKNRAARTDERLISRGPVAVRVIPTNEELEIARMTFVELESDRS
ncbi:MAG TPA: acetate/propionate family kinase [Thermoanaerobaculia bacterium]